MSDAEQTDYAVKPRGERFFTGPLALVFATILIDLIGFGIVIPILPLYAQSELFQASPFWIGQLTSIFSWMQFFFTPIIGLAAAPVALFLAEYRRLKDRDEAITSTKAYMVGWGWAFGARLLIGLAMTGCWMLWAWA